MQGRRSPRLRSARADAPARARPSRRARKRALDLGRALALLACAAVGLAVLLSARTASAYPWMVRHEYTGCVPCHADPSGSGLLTEYGRAQGDILLRTRYGGPPAEEAAKHAGFLWGAVTPPEWLLLGGSFRNAVLWSKSGAASDVRFLQMQADLKAQITVSRFRASGTLGYLNQGGRSTQVTPFDKNNLVSREHWLGVDLGEDKPFLLRAGRINLPFGIRGPEHTLLVRSTTRTDYNEWQQHGIAFSYSGEKVRGEIMAILGNYQLNPDTFRERGYSGFLEISAAKWAAVGVSSLVTHAATDLQLGVANIRQAHGAFTRLAPIKQLVLMAEADALIQIAKTDTAKPDDFVTKAGFVAMLQADAEPVQGLHLMATGETLKDASVPGLTFSGWGSVVWFFLPHMDVRVDFIGTSTATSTGHVPSVSLLSQLHVFL